MIDGRVYITEPLKPKEEVKRTLCDAVRARQKGFGRIYEPDYTPKREHDAWNKTTACQP